MAEPDLGWNRRGGSWLSLAFSSKTDEGQPYPLAMGKDKTTWRCPLLSDHRVWAPVPPAEALQTGREPHTTTSKSP